MNKKFSWKKLAKGILKVFLFCLCFISFSFCLQVMPIVLERVDIVIPDDAINLVELIGLTIVAIGTSIPELPVSLSDAFASAIDGSNSNIGFSNVIGSNISIYY